MTQQKKSHSQSMVNKFVVPVFKTGLRTRQLNSSKAQYFWFIMKLWWAYLDCDIQLHSTVGKKLT